MRITVDKKGRSEGRPDIFFLNRRVNIAKWNKVAIDKWKEVICRIIF